MAKKITATKTKMGSKKKNSATDTGGQMALNMINTGGVDFDGEDRKIADKAKKNIYDVEEAFVNRTKLFARAIAEFYVLESDGGLEFSLGKQNRIKRLANMIFRYSMGAIMGELRHAPERAGFYFNGDTEAPNVEELYGMAGSDTEFSHSRNQIIVGVIDAIGRGDVDAATVKNALIEAEQIFANEDWECGFGGETWALCAANAAKLFKTINDEAPLSSLIIATDQVVSAFHNNGPFLNKFDAWTGFLKYLLTAQATGEIEILRRVAAGETKLTVFKDMKAYVNVYE